MTMSKYTKTESCDKCASLHSEGNNFASVPDMHICTNKASDHYGHAIAPWHPRCKEFNKA